MSLGSRYAPGMSTPDFDAVRAFFATFEEAQCAAWNACLDREVSWLDTVKKKAVLTRFFEAEPGDVVATLSRPRKADDAWYAQHGARDVGPRTVHALQAVRVGGSPMVFLYVSAFERNALGMNERFAVEGGGEAMRIIAREVRCGECGGAGCPVCRSRGWRYAGGRELGQVEPLGDVVRLEAPAHEESRALYHALA